jgi:hypothetical protein
MKCPTRQITTDIPSPIVQDLLDMAKTRKTGRKQALIDSIELGKFVSDVESRGGRILIEDRHHRLKQLLLAR